MRILILGGNGMLGHQLFTYLSLRYEVRVTLRQELVTYQEFGLFNSENAYTGVEVSSYERLVDVFADFHPNVVINGVGIVKQLTAARQSIPSIEINALFPQRLAVLCEAAGARLIHISTDCVFSGRKGNYLESDPSDAEDLYGKSKFLGELHEDHTLTLRTSLIGRQLSGKHSLVEWFLSQHGTIKGFKNFIFSGFTTIEMSRIIEKMLVEYPEASGLYHVSSDPISKFDLLTLIKNKMNLGVEILPDETFQCDRSLDSTRFRRKFAYSPPTWETMVEEFSKSIKGEISLC